LFYHLQAAFLRIPARPPPGTPARWRPASVAPFQSACDEEVLMVGPRPHDEMTPAGAIVGTERRTGNRGATVSAVGISLRTFFRTLSVGEIIRPIDPRSAAMASDPTYEKTTRLTPTWTADANYVKDSDEWIARCLKRVQALDPLIGADEAEKTVRELATLERWRVLGPEVAAEQLYTPVGPTTRGGL